MKRFFFALFYKFLLEITNGDDIDAAAEKIKSVVNEKGLHLLVNNAGVVNYEHSKLENVTAESLMSTFNVNTVGPAMMTKVSKILTSFLYF